MRVTLRVFLRCAHIALAIHYLVILPVDNRTAGYANFEDVGVIGDQTRRHKSAKAPAVDADAVSIYIGERFEIIDTAHLIFHFLLSESMISGRLKSESTLA